MVPLFGATTPDTLASLALWFCGEPIWIVPGNPAPAQVTTLPSWKTARASLGVERNRPSRSDNDALAAAGIHNTSTTTPTSRPARPSTLRSRASLRPSRCRKALLRKR